MPRCLLVALLALACGGHEKTSTATPPATPPPRPPARAEDPALTDAVGAAVRTHEVLTARSVVPASSHVLCNAAMEAASAAAGQPLAAAAWSGDGERDRPLLKDRLVAVLASAKGPLPADLPLRLARAMAVAANNPHVWVVDAGGMGNLLALVSGQKAAGLGFDAHVAGGRWLVSDLHEGGPAAAAGVKRGDLLLALDRRPFDEQSLISTLLVTGGTHAALEVESGGKRKLLDLEAQVIARPIVTSRALGKGIGYLRIHYLPKSKDPAGDAGVLVAGALKELDGKKVDKLVIDLRDDGGGNPFDVASILVHADGPLLMGQDPGGQPQPIPRSAEAWKKRHKMAVLVNGQSYSAAEMLALSLQASGEARVFGEPTGGALTFPGQENLPGGITLFFPAGLALDGKGKLPDRQRVTPDEAVPSTTAEDIAAGRDPQLDAAVAWLKKR